MTSPAKHPSGRISPSRRFAKPGRPAPPRRGPGCHTLIWMILGGITGVALLGSLVFLFVIRPQNVSKPPTLSPAQSSPGPVKGTVVVEPPTAVTAAAATKPPPATPVASGTQPSEPDLAGLGQFMLELINRDRKANGSSPVEWDATAAAAGLQHAQEMADYSYMSHWNRDGYDPDYRYTRAGGLDVAFENVYRLQVRRSDGTGGVISDWRQAIEDAQAALMKSEGHRANILAPEHTHVGIGIAYNATAGDLCLAQEFVNRYVQIAALPRRARPGERLVLRGKLLSGSTEPLVNLAYEPSPPASGLTIEQLNAKGAYSSPAQQIAVVPVSADASGEFVTEIKLEAAAPAGLYHVRLWANSGEKQRVLAFDYVVEVR